MNRQILADCCKNGKRLPGKLVWHGQPLDREYGLLISEWGSWDVGPADLLGLALEQGITSQVTFCLEETENELGCWPVSVVQEQEMTAPEQLAESFWSQNASIWKPAALAFFERLSDYEVLQSLVAKAKTISQSDCEFLIDLVPERVLLLPPARPLRNRKPFAEKLALLLQVIGDSPQLSEEMFAELVDLVPREKHALKKAEADLQRVVDALSDDQSVEFATVVSKLSHWIKLRLDNRLYFHQEAQFLRDRLSREERWSIFDWGIAQGLPDDVVKQVLILEDKHYGRRFWDVRIGEIRPNTRLFRLAPRFVQDDLLRRQYEILLKDWTPYFESVEFDPTKLSKSLDKDDRELALIWAEGRNPTQETNEKRLAIMYSARIAEKVAKEFYERLGNCVTDVSIQQLSKTSSAWKYYDLELDDGRKLDVKNSRFPKNSRTSYVEHRIPEFKHARDGTPVQIVGVVSPYLFPDNFNGVPYRENTKISVLGETNEQYISKLEERFDKVSSNLAVVNLLSTREPYPCGTRYHRLFPPWIFDFPQSFYQNWRKQLDTIRVMPDSVFPEIETLRRFGKPMPIPLLIAAGRDLPVHWKDAIPNWQVCLIEEILKGEAHRSFPVLFLTILTDFIAKIDNPPDTYCPDRYQELLFFKTDRKRHRYPVGLFDPLSQIRSLCQNLETVWRKFGPHELRQFETFKFRGLGILRGLDKRDRKYKTLIAYCGGKTEKKAACGKSNLVLGQEGIKPCPVCGYLICPVCLWCKKYCHECDRRRAHFTKAKEDRSAIEMDTPF